MVGLDENDYSDIALQWMLEELVDDGDEIICLRVIEKDSKIVNNQNLERRQYQKEAMALMERIQTRNDDNRAIGIVLEFAVGKLHATFQKMVRSLLDPHEPAEVCYGKLFANHVADPNLRAGNAYRWYPGSKSWRFPRAHE